MNLIDSLKKTWKDLYDPQKDAAAEIKKHFHPDYEQCINGVTMRRDEYIEHVIAQKSNMIIHHIEYVHHLENANELFTLYYAKGKNSKGSDIEAEVIGYFRFKDHLILKIHGQVRLIKGEMGDVDMER